MIYLAHLETCSVDGRETTQWRGFGHTPAEAATAVVDAWDATAALEQTLTWAEHCHALGASVGSPEMAIETVECSPGAGWRARLWDGEGADTQLTYRHPASGVACRICRHDCACPDAVEILV